MDYLNGSTSTIRFLITATKKKEKKHKCRSKSVSTSSTGSSKISTVEIANIVDRLRREQHRSSTLANYYCVWHLFNRFFVQLDIKPARWEDWLTLFIGYLVKHNKQSSTVKSYISAIKAVLKMHNIKIKHNQYLLSSLTRACRLKNDRCRTRLPIQSEMLGMLLKKTKEYFNKLNQPYLSVLYRTLFLITYYGLLHVSEVTKSAHTIKAGDIQLGENKRKIMIIIRSSKTLYKNMQPQVVKITATGNKQKRNKKPKESLKYRFKLPCPHKLIQKYIDMRGGYVNNSDQFFVFSDGSPVLARHMAVCLKLMLKKAGFNEKYYGTHSLRAGHSCNLHALGVSIENIKKLGHWKSNAVFRYLKTQW